MTECTLRSERLLYVFQSYRLLAKNLTINPTVFVHAMSFRWFINILYIIIIITYEA